MWIGSSRGGETGNSFLGSLDEVAVYRHALTDEEIRRQGEYRETASPPALDQVPEGKVLAELFADAGSFNRPPRLGNRTPEVLLLDALALLDLPQVYAKGGVRADRELPLFVRLAVPVQLPAGRYEMLLRAPGWAHV